MHRSHVLRELGAGRGEPQRVAEFTGVLIAGAIYTGGMLLLKDLIEPAPPAASASESTAATDSASDET